MYLYFECLTPPIQLCTVLVLQIQMQFSRRNIFTFTNKQQQVYGSLWKVDQKGPILSQLVSISPVALYKNLINQCSNIFLLV